MQAGRVEMCIRDRLDSGKGVLCQPLVGNGKVYHFLEAFHVQDNGVPVSYTHLDVYKRQAWI